MSLPPFPFTVLDTETTGFIPRVNRVIEFASVRVENGKEVDAYEELYAINGEIPAHVEVLTRIRTADVQGKAKMEDRQEEILKHIGEGTMIVGQNLSFDIGMLKGEGLDLSDRPWVDTSLLASLVFPELKSYSLQYMSTVLRLSHEPKHRALGDVRATLELFAKIWERLRMLPEQQFSIAKDIMRRSSGGYAMLFNALPAATSTSVPWPSEIAQAASKEDAPPLDLPLPDAGSLTLQEESLDPMTLQSALAARPAEGTMRIIAVKNLDASLRRTALPSYARALHPPSLLLDPEAADRLFAQESFTPDEATAAVKLKWLHPRTRLEANMHGGERDVWNGKLACTEASSVYREQFTHDAQVILLDHRQLLSLLKEGDGTAKPLFERPLHIVIDDASMLEDTATKAYGFSCSLDDLRASAQGNEELMKIIDLLFLWAEQTRGAEDVHFLTTKDLDRRETASLADHIRHLLAEHPLEEQMRSLFGSFLSIIDVRGLADDLAWIERRWNGSITLQRNPKRVDTLLERFLYRRFPTTLLIPEGSADSLPQTAPPTLPLERIVAPAQSPCRTAVLFPEDRPLSSILTSPPTGKSIVLVGSKRLIEQAFIDYTEALEKQTITLICQGLSGGQGRMEAEFAAAEGTALWLLTPWMYEGIELPDNTADFLILDSLPFDHPSQPLIALRKNYYQDGFSEYCVPRVRLRLFRLLRTFCRHKTKNAEVWVTDKRIREKDYGRKMKAYLERFSAAQKEETGEQMKLL